MEVWVLITDDADPVAVYKTEESAKQALIEILDEVAERSCYSEEEYAGALDELEEENQVCGVGAIFTIPYFEL